VRGATSPSIAAVRHGARTRFTVGLVIALLLGVAVAVAAMTTSSTYAITPGSVLRVDPQLRGVGAAPALATPGVAMVDVRLSQLTNLGVFLDRLFGNATLLSATDLGLSGGENLATYQREDRHLMDQSVLDAISAADRELRRRFHRGLPGRVTIVRGAIGGPSAGLAQGLAIIDRELRGSLSRGRFVVASGALAATGAVGPVGGLSAKLTAVERSRATIFFVPRVELAAVMSDHPHGVTVIGVTSLDEAVRVLEAR